MYPNFQEFYQKALIPIGKADKQILHNTLKSENEQFAFATHWLIALEGHQVHKGSDHYHWHVMVFPANADSFFQYKYPHFVSDYMKIDNAIALTRTLEHQAKRDGICSCMCQLNLNVI